jgi:hypothetical protein
MIGVARGAAAGVARNQQYGRQRDEADEVEMEEASKTQSNQTVNDMVEGEMRAGLIRKVYGILSAQMAITTLMCATAMLVPPVRVLMVRLMHIPYANLGIFIPAMCVLCALQAKKAEHPTNYYLLWTFTVLMSLSIAGICAAYQQAGLGYLILQAFAITAACFVGLTVYAMKSGKDFGWMGGMLSMGLMGMIMFSFLGFIFGFSGGILYSLFGVVLFCGFILYDTHRVLRIYGPDDAIMASIELYLDILNLFLYILEILSRMSGGDRS